MLLLLDMLSKPTISSTHLENIMLHLSVAYVLMCVEFVMGCAQKKMNNNKTPKQEKY